MTEITQIPLIRGRWRPVIRITWFVLAFALLGPIFAGFPAYFNELRRTCIGEACALLALSPQEGMVLQDLGFSLNFYAGYILLVGETIIVGTITVLAGLIFWRKSDDWMGVLVSVTLLFSLNGLSNSDVAFVKLVPSIRLLYDILSAFAIVPLVLFLYLFPSGQFVPVWTRYFALLLAGTVLIDPVLKVSRTQTTSGEMSVLLTVLFLISLAVGVSAQIYRFRSVSSLSQRQQTKWVIFGLTALILSVFIWIPLVELFPLRPGLARLAFNTLGYGFLIVPLILAFPVSIAFSIFRYRLWEIDIVINRVLVYGLLTGTLVLVYTGSVVLLQSLFQAFTGESSQLTIVASTLAIAALFNPLQRRIQGLIDRRFYRRKYYAGQVLAQFVATARDEVDLDLLAESLLSLLEETIQPAHVSLWLDESQLGTRTRENA